MSENSKDDDTIDSATLPSGPVDDEPTKLHGAPQGSDMLGIGKRLGEYDLIRRIGKGGMGVVYEARQQPWNKRVAVKILPHSFGDDQRAIQRFQNEAWAAAQFQHRNIIPVYQVGEDQGTHFYAMQYVDGGDLEDLIASLRTAATSGSHFHQGDDVSANAQPDAETQAEGSLKDTSAPRISTRKSGWSKGNTLASQALLKKVAKNGCTSIPQFIDSFVNMAIQVADALHYAHELGIVHRDIKPSNLLLDLEGDVWVADFGLAQFEDGRGLTATGVLIGTYAYMSPEQAMGKKRVGVDQRSDIFSLGVTLYELLTLTRAFSGDSHQETLRKIILEHPVSPRKIDRNIPSAIEVMLMKALAKSPDDRYQTAAELADDLRLFRDDQPIKARKPTIPQRLSRWARVNRQLAIATGWVLAAVLVASIIITIVSQSSLMATAAALQAEKEEKEKVKTLLRLSNGLRLARDAALNLDSNPTLAMILGLEAAKDRPGADANNMILQSHDLNHEIHTFQCEADVGHVAFNLTGTRMVTTGTRDNFTDPRGAFLWDVASGKMLHEFKDGDTMTGITSAVYSPDGARVLTTSSPSEKDAAKDKTLIGREPRIWEDVTYRSLGTFKDAYLYETHDALFDPDARFVVLPSVGNAATIYDVFSRKPIRKLSGHEEPVVFAAFGPQGKRVVTASKDNTVRIWNAESGDLLYPPFDVWKKGGPQSTKYEIDTVQFRPDGRQLVTGSRKYGIQLWDLTNGQLIKTDHSPGSHAFFWPDNMHVASFSPFSSELRILSTKDAKRLPPLELPRIRDAAISPDSKSIVVTHTGTPRISLSSPDKKTWTTLHGHRAVINHVAFSPDSQRIATASSDDTVKLWHVKNGRQRDTYSKVARLLKTKPKIDPAGKQIALPVLSNFNLGSILSFGDRDATIEFSGRIRMPPFSSTRFVAWDPERLSIHSVKSGERLKSISNSYGSYSKAAINPQGTRVAACGDGQTITLWVPDEDRRVPIFIGQTNVLKLMFTPQGDRFVSIDEDGYARVWDADTGDMIEELFHQGRLIECDISRDGLRLATVSDRGRAVVWNLSSFEKTATIQSSDAAFTSVQFNFDGAHVSTFHASKSDEVIVWDADDGQLLYRYPTQGRCHVAAHPTANELLISSDEGAAVWQYESNRKSILTDQPRVHGSYGPDAKHLFTCSDLPWEEQSNGNILDSVPAVVDRWSNDDQKLLDRIELPFGDPQSFFVSQDERIFLYAAYRHAVAVHDVNTYERVARLNGHLAAVTDMQYVDDGNTLITTARDGRVRFWSLPEGKLQQSLLEHERPITRSILASGNERLITVDETGRAIVWAVETRKKLQEFSLGSQPIDHLAVDSTGSHLLAISDANEIHFYDLKKREAEQFDLNIEKAAWAEYSPENASMLIIPSAAREVPAEEKGIAEPPRLVLVAPLDRSKPVSEYRFSAPIVTSHFHPDGTEIVTLTRDGLVTFTNLASGQASQTIKVKGSGVFAARINPSGEWVAVHVGSAASLYRIEDGKKWWEVNTGAMAIPAPMMPAAFRSYALDRFDPFVSADSDRAVLAKGQTLFSVPLDPASQAKIAPRPLTAVERSRFLEITGE